MTQKEPIRGILNFKQFHDSGVKVMETNMNIFYLIPKNKPRILNYSDKGNYYYLDTKFLSFQLTQI